MSLVFGVAILLGYLYSTEAQCSCGIKNDASAANRIVGGVETQENEYPWQVLVTYTRRGSATHLCGGSLISRDWVLTAAHCLTSGRAKKYGVLLGDHNIYQADAKSQFYGVSQKIIHNSYSSRTTDNDIGLLKIAETVTFTTEISPVCLPISLASLSTGDSLTVTGWGATSAGGYSTDVLMEVDVDYISSSDCRSSNYVYGNAITDNMFCAGVTGGGKDSCQGDSGGPVVYEDSNSVNFLVGIVSWGIGCADADAPGVYTKVANYLDWINEKTGAQSEFCDI